MSEPQSGGLVQNLPKIKKQSSKDNVRNVAIKSRDAQDIVSTAQHSYLDSQYNGWEITSVRLITNKELDEQYRTKRAELKEDGRHTRDVQDQFAFLLVKDDKVVNQITQYGLRARESSFNALGDSKMGVHVCRHADVQLRLAEIWGLDGCNIVIFKVILGKCKVLSTQGNASESMEPTPNYDCHISNTKPKVSDSVTIQAARSQIFLYEYNEDCEIVERPRHCIPHAIVTYNWKSSSVTEPKAKGYTSEKSSGYSRSLSRSADNVRSNRPRLLLQPDINLSPATVTLTRQPSWPAKIVTEGEGQPGQTPARIHQRSFSNETTLPANYRMGQDQQMSSHLGLNNVDVYQTRKDPRIRRNSAQELEELSAQDVDLRPNRGVSQDFDGRILQVAEYNLIANQSSLLTDSSQDWFDNSAETDMSFSSLDVDYRKMYSSQTEQVSSGTGDGNYETYSTVGRRLSQGSASNDPRLNRAQTRTISSDSQLSEEGQTGGDNSHSDNSSVQKKKVKTQISLAAYKARKKQIEDSKVSEFSSAENPLVSNINMDIDNLKTILQTTNSVTDNSSVPTPVGTLSTAEASQILDKFERIPDVQTHLANFDVSNLKMILETAKTPTETPTSPGFTSNEMVKTSEKNGSESNSVEQNSTHDESQNTVSEQTRTDPNEQLVFFSSLRDKTEDEIIFFPNVKSEVKDKSKDQGTSSAMMSKEQKQSNVKDDNPSLPETKSGGEFVVDDSFFSRVKSEGEFCSDRSKIPGLSASPSEESENMDADLVKSNIPSGSSNVSDSKSDISGIVGEAKSPQITVKSTPSKDIGNHSLGEGLDNKISPIQRTDLDDSDLGTISCEGSLESSHASLSKPLNSSPIKSFSEFHHLTPKQLKAFIESQTQLMKHYKEPREQKAAVDKESPEEKKKPYIPKIGTAISPLTISSESSSQKTIETGDSQKSYLADVSSQESPSVFKSKPKMKPKAKPNKDMMGYRRRRRRKKTKKTDVADDMDPENISITSTTSSEYLWQDENFDRLSDRSWVTPTPSECAESRHCRPNNAQSLSDYQLSHWTQAATRPDFQPRVVLTDVRKRTHSVSTESEVSWKISSTNSTIELEQETGPASGKDLQLDTDDMYTKHTEERVKQWIQVARKKIKLTLKPVKKDEDEKSEKLKEEANIIPVLSSSQSKEPSSPVRQDHTTENRPEDKSSYQVPDVKSEYPSVTESSVSVPILVPSSEYLQRDPPAVSHYIESTGSYVAPSSTYNPAVTAYDPTVTAYNPTVTAYNTAVTAYNPTVTAYNTAVTAYNPTVTVYDPAVTAYNPTVTDYDPPVTAYNSVVSTYNSSVPYPSHTVAASVPNSVFAQPPLGTSLPQALSYTPHTIATTLPMSAYAPQMSGVTVQSSPYPQSGGAPMIPPCRLHQDTGQGPLASPLQPPGPRPQMPPGPGHLHPPPPVHVDMNMHPQRPSSFDPRLRNTQGALPRVINEHAPRHQAPVTVGDVGRPPNSNFMPAAAGPHPHLQPRQHAPLQRPPGIRPLMGSQATPVSHGSDMMVGMSSGGRLPYPQNTATNAGPGPHPGPAGNRCIRPTERPQFFQSPHQHPPPQMHQRPPMTSAMPHPSHPGPSIPRQRPVQTQQNMAMPPPRSQVPGVSAAMGTLPPRAGDLLPPPGVRGPGIPPQNVQPIRGSAPSHQGMNRPQSLVQQPQRQQVHMGNVPPPVRPHHVHPLSGHPTRPPPSSNTPRAPDRMAAPPNQIPTIQRMQQQGNQYSVGGFPPPQNAPGLFRPAAFTPPGAPPGMHPSQHFSNTAPHFHQPRMQHNFPPGYNQAPPANPIATAPPVTSTITKRPSDVMDWFTDKLAPKKSSSDTGDYGNKTWSANNLFDIAFSGTKTNSRPDHFLGISSQCMCTGTPTTQGSEEKLDIADGHQVIEGLEGKNRQEVMDREGKDGLAVDKSEEFISEKGNEKYKDFEGQGEVDMEIETSSEDGNDTLIVIGEDNDKVNKHNVFYDADAVSRDILKHNEENYESSNDTILEDEKPYEKSELDRDSKNNFSSLLCSDSDRTGSSQECKQTFSDSMPVALKNMKPLLDLLNGDGDILSETSTHNLAEPSRQPHREHPNLIDEKKFVQDTHSDETNIVESMEKGTVHAEENFNMTTTLPTNNELGDGQILHASDSSRIRNDIQTSDTTKINTKLETVTNSKGIQQQKMESPGSPTKSVLRSGDQFVPSVLLRKGLLKGVEADKLKHPVISKKSATKEEPVSSTYSVLRGASETSKETTDCVENSLKIRLTMETPNSSTLDHGTAAGTVNLVSSIEANEDIYTDDDLGKSASRSASKTEKKSDQMADDGCDDDVSCEGSLLSDTDMIDALLEKGVTESKKSGQNLENMTDHSRRKPLVINEAEKSISEAKKMEDSYERKHRAKSIYNAKTGAWTTKSSEESKSTESDTEDYSPKKEYWKPLRNQDDLDSSFGNKNEREYSARRGGSWPSRDRQYIDSKDTDSHTSVFDPKSGAWVNRNSVTRKSEERMESRCDAVVYDFRRGAWTTSEEVSSYKSKNVPHKDLIAGGKRNRSGSHGGNDVCDLLSGQQKNKRSVGNAQDKENTTSDKVANSNNRAGIDTKTGFYKSRTGSWIKHIVTTENKKQENLPSQSFKNIASEFGSNDGVKEGMESVNKPSHHIDEIGLNKVTAAKTKDNNTTVEGKKTQRDLVLSDKQQQNSNFEAEKDTPSSDSKLDISDTKLEKKSLTGAEKMVSDTKPSHQDNQGKLSPEKSAAGNCNTESKTGTKKSPPIRRRKTSTTLKTGTISDLFSETLKSEKSTAYQLTRSRPGRGRSTSYSSSEESLRNSHRTWNYKFYRKPSWKRYSRSPSHSRRSRSRRRYLRSRSFSSERRSRRRYSRSPSYSSERRSRSRHSKSRHSSRSRSRKRYSRSRSYSSRSRSRRRYSRSPSSSVSRSRKRNSRSPSYSSRSRRRYSRSPSSSVSRSRKRNSRSPSYSTISSSSDRTAFSPRGSWRGHGRWMHSDRHRSHSRRSRSRYSRSPSYSSISTVSDIRPSQYQSRRRSRNRYSRSPSVSTVSTSSLSASPMTKTKSSPWMSSDSSRQPRFSKFTSSRFPESQKSPDTVKKLKIDPTVNLESKLIPDNSKHIDRKQSSSIDKNEKDTPSSNVGTSESPYSSSQSSIHKDRDSAHASRKVEIDSRNRHLFRDKPPSDYSRSSSRVGDAGYNRCRSPSPRNGRISEVTRPLKQDPLSTPRVSSPYSPSSPTGCQGEMSPDFIHNTTDSLGSRDNEHPKPTTALGKNPDRNTSKMSSEFTSSHSFRDIGKAKEDFPIKFLFKDKITRKVSLSPERRFDSDSHSRQSVSGNQQGKEQYSRNFSHDRYGDIPTIQTLTPSRAQQSIDRCYSSVSPARISRLETSETFVGDRRHIQKANPESGVGRESMVVNSSSLKDQLNQRKYHSNDSGHPFVRNIETSGGKRKFEQFDNFSLDYLSKTQEKLRLELKGLDGTGSNSQSPDLDKTKGHFQKANSVSSNEFRTVSVERKNPLVSYESPPREEEINRGKVKVMNIPDRHVKKEPSLFRDSFRRVCPMDDKDKLQIVRDVFDRSIDRELSSKLRKTTPSVKRGELYSNRSSEEEKSDFHSKDDIHRTDDHNIRKDYQTRGDLSTGNTVYVKNDPYRSFQNPRPNHPYKKASSTRNAAEDWSQSLGNKAVQERSPGTRPVRPTPSKPGNQGLGENFNELLRKEQLRLDLVKKKPSDIVPQETIILKGERTVTASNQAECIDMCSCSTSIPFTKNELAEELMKVTRSVEKLWKDPLEDIDSMTDRLPKELEEFCIQSGLTQLELENSKVIPQARSAIIRQDIQQFESEIKMRITQSNYYGVCSQRVPSELLTKQEERKFFSEEGMFLILCNPIPWKTYQKLSILKKKLDELQDKIDFETKNGMSSLVRSLTTEKQLARDERKRQLFTFTGCLTKKRLNKMRVKERYYLRCYNYFRKEYGEAADDMFPYLRMCMEDSANHIAIMTKLRSEDKDEAAIVEEEKKKEREKIQRQRVLQGLMMDIRTVDSKLSDMYFSCDITEHFPSCVKGVVQHVHQRVNSVAEFLSEELMSDEPNSGAVGRLRATHKFCLKAFEFVKKNIAEANNPCSVDKLSGQKVKDMESSNLENRDETEKLDHVDERETRIVNNMERKKDENEMNTNDETSRKMDDSVISNSVSWKSECCEGKNYNMEREDESGVRFDFGKKIDYFDVYKSDRESEDEMENDDYLCKNNLKSDNSEIDSGIVEFKKDELKEEIVNMERERDEANVERSYLKIDSILDGGENDVPERENDCSEREINNVVEIYNDEQVTSPIKPEGSEPDSLDQERKDDNVREEDSHLVQTDGGTESHSDYTVARNEDVVRDKL
ncbi:LOW QUALITY PROTEIN: uncharacterized protein LOC117332589 [Pecten maximus]|uniref:LOW QUALITY PROTEIN: uncharacterized protein LOC117332589 n=1 Tax=Pecten maximus TaxID=6579 RepID=UPI0014587DAA|nr:LOW QUALITY PROTEIN: uncharacterized protein LOC117332589 [Pecten maximus]